MQKLIAIFALATTFATGAASAIESNITDHDTQAGVSESPRFLQAHTSVTSLPEENFIISKPTVVPETTSIALGLLGLLLILRRRK